MSEKKKTSAGRITALIIIIIIVAALISPSLLGFLPEGFRLTLTKFSENYLGAFQPLKDSNGQFDYLRIVALIVAMAACWAVNAILQFILRSFKAKTRRGNTVKSLFASLIKYIIAIYAIIYGLSILGFNVGAVIASLGVLGLVIGFGAQSLIEDIITGLFIVLEGNLQVGDIVAVDEWRGTVTNIGIRTATIMDTGNNCRIVNNSDIRNFVNLSSISSKAVILAPIAYETDLVKAEEEVKALCAKLPAMYPEIFKTAPQYMGVETLNESSVDLKISADVNEADIFTAKRLLNREVFLAFGKCGIEIPFNQCVVHMAKD